MPTPRTEAIMCVLDWAIPLGLMVCFVAALALSVIIRNARKG